MIEFKDISPEILESTLAWLDTKQKGKWYQSTEMTPQDRKNKLKHQLYSEDYKRVESPNADCYTMFMDSNRKGNQEVRVLKDSHNRKVKAVPWDGNSLFLAILEQVSHLPKYTPDML